MIAHHSFPRLSRPWLAAGVKLSAGLHDSRIRIRKAPETKKVAVEEAAETRDVGRKLLGELLTEKRVQRRACLFFLVHCDHRTLHAPPAFSNRSESHAIPDRSWMKSQDVP